MYKYINGLKLLGFRQRTSPFKTSKIRQTMPLLILVLLNSPELLSRVNNKLCHNNHKTNTSEIKSIKLKEN